MHESDSLAKHVRLQESYNANEANLTAYLRLSNSEDNRKSSKDGIVPRSIEPHSITNRYSDNYDSSSMTPGYISYCNVEPRRIEATKNNLKDAYV